MEKKILVTGASGFIGSFLVEGALERGMQVWAGVRKSSSRKYLQDPRIHLPYWISLIPIVWQSVGRTETPAWEWDTLFIVQG